MKFWKNIETGKILGHYADFPNGLDGCALFERDEAVAVVPTEGVDERAVLALRYEAKFGKAPHPHTKIETLRERVEE